jgi:hypothetical protein
MTQQNKEACRYKESEELLENITDVTGGRFYTALYKVMGTKMLKEVNCDMKSFFSSAAICCGPWLPIRSILWKQRCM